MYVSLYFIHYLERAHKGFINAHHATCIVKLPTVVWSREKCDQLAFGKELISILHNLREDTWHYSNAYSNQYQETNFNLLFQNLMLLSRLSTQIHLHFTINMKCRMHRQNSCNQFNNSSFSASLTVVQSVNRKVMNPYSYLRCLN